MIAMIEKAILRTIDGDRSHFLRYEKEWIQDSPDPNDAIQFRRRMRLFAGASLIKAYREAGQFFLDGSEDFHFEEIKFLAELGLLRQDGDRIKILGRAFPSNELNMEED